MPGMSWGLWLHRYPSERRPEKVDIQVFKSSVPWMMGLFRTSRISVFFKISVNPMVRLEVPQASQTWIPSPPIPAPHARSLCFSMNIPGHCITRKKRCLKRLIAGAKGEIIIIQIACSSERAGQTSRDAMEPVSLGSWGMLRAPLRRTVQQYRGERLRTPLV